MIKLNHCLPKVPWFTLLGWFLIFRHLDQLKMRSLSFIYKLTELTNITAFWIFIRINISLSLLPSFSSSTSTRMLSFGGCYWIRLAKQAIFFAIMTVYIFSCEHTVSKTSLRHCITHGDHDLLSKKMQFRHAQELSSGNSEVVTTTCCKQHVTKCYTVDVIISNCAYGASELL